MKNILAQILFVGLFSSIIYFYAPLPAFADQIIISNMPDVDVAVEKDSEGYAKFSGKGFQIISVPGEPMLPYQVITVLLPRDAVLSTVKVVTEREYVSERGVVAEDGGITWEVRKTPEPVWNGYGSGESRDNDDIYSTNMRFPQDIIRYESTGQIREWQLVDIPIVLFRYNPVTRKLYRLITEQVTVEFEKNPAKSARKAKVSDRIGEERVKKLAVNFDEFASEYKGTGKARSAASQKIRYVVITTNSIRNNSRQFANFVSHKEKRGFEVLVVTEDKWGGGIGDIAAENIRNWLKGNYINERIEYVLLIGNPDPQNGNVPMKMLYPRNNAKLYPEYKESPSDYYYADLTGNWDLDLDGKYGEWGDDFGHGGIDRHYEVVVGRIPFYGNTDDLDNILKKIIAYQNETDETWRKNVLLAMAPSDRSTPGYPLGEAIKDNIIEPKGWNYQQIYDENCNEDNVVSTWKKSLFGAVFWWSHGTPTSATGIISNKKTLDNVHPGFTFQASCSNSYPEASDNLSYALLKNGAIATVGATREVWYYPGQKSFIGNHTSAGMAFEYARYAIAENKPCGYALQEIKENLKPVQTLWMNFTGFCLYGDPETRLISISNGYPTISDIPDQNIDRNATVTIPFTIADDITPSWNLSVSANSSNTSLVPNENISVSDSGSERTIEIMPAPDKAGTTVVKVTVSDGENENTDTFILKVDVPADWEWQNPFPQGNDYHDIWISPDDEIFIVGGGGTVLHNDGNGWTEMKSNTFVNLQGVWGSSGNDIFAVGFDGTIIHYDGNSWTEMQSNVYSNLWSVWGNSKNDVFAVGSYGTIIHYDGESWIEMTSGTSVYLVDIWGSSGNDIFAIGWNKKVFHYNGSHWTEMADIGGHLYSIWGSADNDVFVVGDYYMDYNEEGWRGGLFHYDGNSWSNMPLESNFRATLSGVWGRSANDIFAVSSFLGPSILHYDGVIWERIEIDGYPRFFSIFGNSKNEIFAIGPNNTIFKYNGTSWTSVISNDDNKFDLYKVWGSSSNNVFSFGYDEFLHYDGNSWTKIELEKKLTVIDFFDGDNDEGFALTREGSILHYDGNSWAEIEANDSFNFKSACEISDNHIIALNDFVTDNNIRAHQIFHYDGNNWSEIPIENNEYLSAIWGSSVNDIFAVGYGVILHYNGIKWTKNEISYHVYDIWGSSNTDVFAIGRELIDSPHGVKSLGDKYAIFHYDGNSWREMKSISKYTGLDIKNWLVGVVSAPYDLLLEIWGTSDSNDSNVFIVGGYGTILHYDGSNWTEMTSNTSKHLRSLWGTENDVFAVGDGGTILHYSPQILSVTPISLNINESKGTTTLHIKNSGSGEMNWTAETNNSWLSISPNTGINEGEIIVSYETNPGNAARTGTITITAEGATNSPQTIEIRQSANTGTKLKLADVKAEVEKSVSIPLNLINPSSIPIQRIDIQVPFDTSALETPSVTLKDTLLENRNYRLDPNPDIDGQIEFTLTANDANLFNGEGDIAIIEFGKLKATTDLQISNAKINGSAISTEGSSAKIEASPGPIPTGGGCFVSASAQSHILNLPIKLSFYFIITYMLLLCLLRKKFVGANKLILNKIHSIL